MHAPSPASPACLACLQAAPAASGLETFQLQQIAASLLGFLCYKAALVGVAIIPPPVGGETGLLQADAGRGTGGSRPRRVDRRDGDLGRGPGVTTVPCCSTRLGLETRLTLPYAAAVRNTYCWLAGL